jgi:ABC-type nitrate/sulfonate/bicarbonate transport system permease component
MTANTIKAKTGSDLEAAIDTGGNEHSSRQSLLYGGGAVVLLMVGWELYVSIFHVNRLLLPTPVRIVSAFHTYVSSGEIWPDLGFSSKELFGGYFIAVLAGLVIGMLAGWYRSFGYVVTPWASFFLAVPIIGITPLIIIWVGLNLQAKIIIVALSSFFPIMLNTMAGVRTLDKRLIRLERSYCANDFQIFRTLALPSVVPFALAGMRVGVAWAIVGVYVAEISNGSSEGIGFMMSNAADTFQTARFFVGLIIIGCGGIFLTTLISVAQRRLLRGYQLD